MTKFFRQIRHEFVNKNKLTKYLKYAVGEIALIVIGILVALQINNWNETQSERIQEVSYLTNFKDDLETTKIELQRIIGKSENTALAASTTLKLISLDKPPSETHKLDSLIYRSTSHTTFAPKEGTTFEILNAGDLAIIREYRIRRYISEWQSRLIYLRGLERLQLEAMKDLQGFINENFLSYAYGKGSGIIPIERKTDILVNHKFRNYLDNVRYYNQKLSELYTITNVEMDTMITAVDKYLDDKR